MLRIAAPPTAPPPGPPATSLNVFRHAKVPSTSAQYVKWAAAASIQDTLGVPQPPACCHLHFGQLHSSRRWRAGRAAEQSPQYSNQHIQGVTVAKKCTIEGRACCQGQAARQTKQNCSAGRTLEAVLRALEEKGGRQTQMRAQYAIAVSHPVPRCCIAGCAHKSRGQRI